MGPLSVIFLIHSYFVVGSVKDLQVFVALLRLVGQKLLTSR